MTVEWDPSWNPHEIVVNDPTVSKNWKICVLQGVVTTDSSTRAFDGLAGRIAAIFVIFITSLLATLVPVLTRKHSRIKVPEIVYTTAKNFGTGVIIATAIIHLIDPAMQSLGRHSCVGSSEPWRHYRWCTAFMLIGAMLTFIVDIYCQFFNERWYGAGNLHSHAVELAKDKKCPGQGAELSNFEFKAEFSRFLILEIGVVVHSVFIGLTLGSTEKWLTLFVVIIFHQAFEGLGIGARMSTIEFPKGKRWWPMVLSLAYSLTTPISIAIGILARNSYRDNGVSQMTVQGICDALSCGIMIYTGFVELVARDYIFVDHSSKSLKDLNIQTGSLLLGAGLMSVVGKWA